MDPDDRVDLRREEEEGEDKVVGSIGEFPEINGR